MKKGNKSETTTLRQIADELIIAREEKAELATENYQYLLKYNRF